MPNGLLDKARREMSKGEKEKKRKKALVGCEDSVCIRLRLSVRVVLWLKAAFRYFLAGVRMPVEFQAVLYVVRGGE